MNRLSDYSLCYIFEFLNPMDISSITLVCRRFYLIVLHFKGLFRLSDFSDAEERMKAIPTIGVWQSLQYVKYLSLRCCVQVTSFSAITEMKTLLSLDVYCTQVQDEVLCSLPQKLEAIDVGCCEAITKVGLERFILQQPRLIHVGLAGLKNVLCQEVLDALSTCDIQYMDISESSVSGSLSSFFRDKSNLCELSIQGPDLTETSTILNFLSRTTLRVLEIGPIPEFLFSQEEEAIDDILEVLRTMQGLRMLSLINCTIRNTSDDLFRHFSSLRIYLWQCHRHLIECIKNSANQNISYQINPYSQLSKILYK